jgi:ribosomal protein L13E
MEAAGLLGGKRAGRGFYEADVEKVLIDCRYARLRVNVPQDGAR